MVKKTAGKRADSDDAVAVDQRVRVYVDTDDEVRGVIVEDFGDLAGHAVDVGDVHISDAARRWFAWRVRYGEAGQCAEAD